ncbi:hypothetical protein [Bacillus sp. 1P06AnD]|uniref:hypothetical protein n=1 Tax=Bacillus sp. 1P06AnD TaxID=3132208 RepID=UPI0039A0F699
MSNFPGSRFSTIYDEELIPIDRQICALIKKRNDLSPQSGFPPDSLLMEWIREFGFHEDFIRSVFSTLRLSEFFKPKIEPAGYRKHLPVLRSTEVNQRFYSVSYIRQYENASVIQLHIDWNEEVITHIRIDRSERKTLGLWIGEEYECRQERSGGSNGYYSHTFIVSPPLPDDLIGVKLLFIEYSDPFGDEPTGLEIKMDIG